MLHMRSFLRSLPLVLLLPACAPEPDPAPATPRKRALIIGIDGTRPDALQKASTPNIDEIFTGGASTYAARTQQKAPTKSSPGWASVLTGVDADKHGIFANYQYGERDFQYRTLFDRATHELDLKVAVSTAWVGIVDLEEEGSTAHSLLGYDASVAEDMVAAIDQGAYDVHFIHFNNVDSTGHTSGFDPNNPKYIAAIETVDGLVGTLLDAVKRRPAEESWLLAVTTDHGGEGTDHGAQDEACQTIFLAFKGEGITPGNIDGASHMDVQPTVLRFFGRSPDPAWDLDGKMDGFKQ
jgi:predicted AlkP superfamily pyrophosphatase or phosphodiesterase